MSLVSMTLHRQIDRTVFAVRAARPPALAANCPDGKGPRVIRPTVRTMAGLARHQTDSVVSPQSLFRATLEAAGPHGRI